MPAYQRRSTIQDVSALRAGRNYGVPKVEVAVLLSFLNSHTFLSSRDRSKHMRAPEADDPWRHARRNHDMIESQVFLRESAPFGTSQKLKQLDFNCLIESCHFGNLNGGWTSFCH